MRREREREREREIVDDKTKWKEKKLHDLTSLTD